MPALGFTAVDYALMRRVLAKLDRWYTPGSGSSSPGGRSVAVQAQGANGTGVGVLLSAPSLARVGLLIYAPPGASNLYLNTAQNFGQVNAAASSTQYGVAFTGDTYLTWGHEYAGPIYAYNAAALGSPLLDVRVLELFADPNLIGAPAASVAETG